MSLQIALNSNLDKPMSQYLLLQYDIATAAKRLKERGVPAWVAAMLLNQIKRGGYDRR